MARSHTRRSLRSGKISVEKERVSAKPTLPAELSYSLLLSGNDANFERMSSGQVFVLCQGSTIRWLTRQGVLHLWLRMLSATELILQEMRRRVEFDAELPQFGALSLLYREQDGWRPGALSQKTMATNGNVTDLVERLENDGILIRTRLGDDRRVTVAKLTDKGHMVFGKMAQAHENWLRDLMKDLDPTVLRGLYAYSETSRMGCSVKLWLQAP